MPNTLENGPSAIVAADVNPLLLHRASRLAGVAFEDLAGLAGASSYLFVPRGHVVYRQGDAADAVYAVLNGRVELERRSESRGLVDQREACLHATFGDGVLIGEVDRRHTARAACRSILVRIPSSRLVTILPAYPDIASDWIFDIMTRPRRGNWQRRSARQLRKLSHAPTAA